MKQALDIGMVLTERRLRHLAGLLRSGLARVPGVTVRDRGRRLCAICSFTKARSLAPLMDLARTRVTADRLTSRTPLQTQGQCQGFNDSILSGHPEDHGVTLSLDVYGVQEGKSAPEVVASLAARGINVWVSSASSTLLDFQRRGLQQVGCLTSCCH